LLAMKKWMGIKSVGGIREEIRANGVYMGQD
jgi:hypothetical protein